MDSEPWSCASAAPLLQRGEEAEHAILYERNEKLQDKVGKERETNEDRKNESSRETEIALCSFSLHEPRDVSAIHLH